MSISSRDRKLIGGALRDARLRAGLRQGELASRLGRPQSFVSKYEVGERRLDMLEVRDVCRAVGLDFVDFCVSLERVLEEDPSAAR